MRIFLGMRIEENYKNDKRTSNHNYGSRQDYSVESELIEKRLILNLAKREEKQVTCTISDLEACYDIQLPNIGGAFEESMRVNREVIKLFTKVLPRCKHFRNISWRESGALWGNE